MQGQKETKDLDCRQLILFGLATVTLGGCLTFHRPTYRPIASEVIQEAGFSIDRPEAIVDPEGLRFHNWICRDRRGLMGPDALRLERLNEAGEVVDVARAGVELPNRPGCTVYDIRTRWKLRPGERVRLCAARGAEPCPAKSTGNDNR